MIKLIRFLPCVCGLSLALLLAWSGYAGAHGRTIFEEDECIIELGFFKAHFSVYQPYASDTEEYCDEIPESMTETVFSLEYLHNSLKQMPVDFRIIEDINDVGRNVEWNDIKKIPDIERHTVFYQPPVIRTDAEFRVAHQFKNEGRFIGIFTTRHPTLNKTYQAVFPFEVGSSFNYGYVALFLSLIVLIELFYLYTNGKLATWKIFRPQFKQDRGV